MLSRYPQESDSNNDKDPQGLSKYREQEDNYGMFSRMDVQIYQYIYAGDHENNLTGLLHS